MPIGWPPYWAAPDGGRPSDTAPRGPEASESVVPLPRSEAPEWAPESTPGYSAGSSEADSFRSINFLAFSVVGGSFLKN